MENKILRSRAYLYATEFFAGMSVMAVELGASRLLAPYFSSSQIVWTIIIGTIMIALALGNVFGGRWADSDANPARLYRRIIFAAIWIALIPVLGKFVIVAVAGILIVTVDVNLLIWAAFFSCMAIFVLPLFLLGTVTPSLVKYATDSLEHNGRVVGNLNAFNTVGSIIGTFLPTFVTIPAVGTAVTFLIFSGILFAIGLAYFLSAGGQKFLCAVAAGIFLLASVLGSGNSFAFWKKDLAYEGESIYNYLQVRDDARATVLSTNVLIGVQSIRVKSGGLTGMYYDYALAAPVLTGGGDVLVLGMGTGTFAQACQKYFPASKVAGVEIDEKITALAHEYFALAEEIPVATYDGRAYLAADKKLYDVIMVDAYQDITIPFQMSSVEFFALVRAHLKAGGVMVVNMNMRGEINDWLTDTIGEVFPAVRAVDVGGNREVFAAADEAVFNNFERRADLLSDKDLRGLMEKIARSWRVPSTGGNILTDDKAPVELLGMRSLDRIIQRELKNYKQLDFRRFFD
ncbi:MAG: fused MFS/spermidine synthase [Selenomonadaceae bacterium]|nr:fused MFS/spermidine synthase [Selenomonadaceae bacterium]